MYLYAIQDSNGREIVSLKSDSTDVSFRVTKKRGTIIVDGKNSSFGEVTEQNSGPFTLYRWEESAKLEDPVSLEYPSE